MESALLAMPPILLIPGNMCDARLWQPVADVLREAGHTVLHAPRLDQKSVEEMTEVVGTMIVGSAAVVGFSMGAIVAAELARRSPQRVKALGLSAFNASADLPERAAVRPRQQEAVRQGHLETIVADE